jgi:hypothetical protein
MAADSADDAGGSCCTVRSKARRLDRCTERDPLMTHVRR